VQGIELQQQQQQQQQQWITTAISSGQQGSLQTGILFANGNPSLSSNLANVGSQSPLLNSSQTALTMPYNIYTVRIKPINR
jgi:hypothetical protein